MIYALWYYFKDGEKTTNAISLNPKLLDILHEESIKNPNNLYHQYKKYISNIEIEPIDCYLYNEEFNRLDRIQNFNQLSNGLFYASQHITDSIHLTDILVYLTKKQYELWRQCIKEKNCKEKENEYPSFFYENFISHNEVKMNEYYEDGIMNT